MTSKMTKIEKEMFDKGYVTSRMAAFKLKLHFKSVLGKVSRGEFKAIRLGQQQFIEMSSIKEHYGEDAAKVLGLDNWGDVFEEKEGELHIKSAEA